MIVVVDERELVKDGYTSLFGREGVPSTGFHPSEFGDWVSTAADTDIDAVEGIGLVLEGAVQADGFFEFGIGRQRCGAGGVGAQPGL